MPPRRTPAVVVPAAAAAAPSWIDDVHDYLLGSGAVVNADGTRRPRTAADHDEAMKRCLLASVGVGAVAGLALAWLWWKTRRPRSLLFMVATTPTAQDVAFLRWLHPGWSSTVAGVVTEAEHAEKLGHDQYARYFLTDAHCGDGSEEFKKQARKTVDSLLKGSCGWMWARTRCIDLEVYRAVMNRENPLQQLAIIGAGFDTRCYRFRAPLAHRHVRGFEVDLPAIQAHKREVVKKIQQREGEDIGAANVTYVPLDLGQSKEQLRDGLVASGFKTQRSMFVVEGLTMYLRPARVASLLEFLGESCAPGSLLIATFIASDTSRDSWLGPLLRAKKEPHLSHFTADEFTSLLIASGWSVQNMRTPEQVHAEFAPEEPSPVIGEHIVLARRA